MLSFDVTHPLTDLPIAMQAAADRHGRPPTPDLAVILIRRPNTSRTAARNWRPCPC